MKKIALSLAVVATLAMVSCGNKAENTDTATVDTVATEEVVVATDSDSNVTETAVAVEETVAPATDSNKAAAADKAEAKAEEKAAEAAK